MMEIFDHLLNVMLPVLLCASVGYGLAVTRQPFDTKLVGNIVRIVGYPTLILSSLGKQHIGFESFLMVLLAAAAMITGFAFLGFICLKLLKLPIRAYLSPMMLSNAGNVGIPVALLAFGAEGVTVAIGFVAVTLIAIFTVGKAIPSGEFHAEDLLYQPALYAVAVGLVLMATGWRLPGPIEQSVDILAGLSVPLMLLILGYSVAKLKLGNIIRAATLTGCHIVIGVLVAMALVAFIPLQGKILDAVILMCFMPPAVSVYLWIDKYQPDYAGDVAGFILLAKLSTLLVVPVVLTLLA